MLENPDVREVFFPSGGSEVAVEAALSVDAPAVFTLAERHLGRRRAELIAETKPAPCLFV